MIQTLAKNWVLLAAAGSLHAAICIVYLTLWSTNGPVPFHSWSGTVGLLGELSLAAGVCTIAAGLLRSKAGKCWHLVINGLALCSLGAIYCWLIRFRITLLTVAMLVIVMALSSGLLELRTGRMRRHIAGAAQLGFAIVFLALGLGWIRQGPGSHLDLLWLGLYFGCSAICLLDLSLGFRAMGLRVSP